MMNRKKMKNRTLLLSIFFLGVVVSCTDDFNEINEQPDALAVSDVSAKFFVTSLQKGLFKPVAGPLWFGQIFHQDQYAGQHSGGHSQYAWDGNFGWEYTGWLQEGTNGWLASNEIVANKDFKGLTQLVRQTLVCIRQIRNNTSQMD